VVLCSRRPMCGLMLGRGHQPGVITSANSRCPEIRV
jgi:hypothetical protein